MNSTCRVTTGEAWTAADGFSRVKEGLKPEKRVVVNGPTGRTPMPRSTVSESGALATRKDVWGHGNEALGTFSFAARVMTAVLTVSVIFFRYFQLLETTG